MSEQESSPLDSTGASLSASEQVEGNAQTAELEGPEVVGSHVCDTCIGDNLLKSCGIRTCARCLNPFCIHFASKVDSLTYCVSCMSAIELTRSIVTKTYEHYNEETDVIRSYTRRAREIKLEGDDWMFAQRRIATLSDAELDMVIEYHRQYLMLLCNEQERRRMERMHRNASVKYVVPTASATTTTVTTTKKTKTVKLDKQKEKAAAMLSALTPEMIAALLASMKK